MSLNEEKTCWRFKVSGRVQGVFFRASACQQAQRLGLTGWARNMQDGCVDVLICGSLAALEEMERWLWQGSEMADVKSVLAVTVDVDAPGSFSYE